MPRKKGGKGKKLLFVVVPIILVVIFGLILVVSNYLKREELTGLEGFTTLSLSNADFRSKSEFFNEKTWILYVSQGGMAQNAEGIIEKEDVDQESGTSPKNDLFIDIGYSTQTCEYPIVKVTNTYPIKKFEIKTWGVKPLKPEMGCNQNEANSRCNDYYWYGKFDNSFKCFCVEETVSYPIGFLDSPQVHTQAEIDVQSKGESYTFDFNTRGDVKGYVGSNVYVKWDGYKTTSMPCSILSQKSGLVADSGDVYLTTYYNGNWRVISKNNYDRYLNKRDSLDNYIGEHDVTQDYWETQMGLLNEKSNIALQPQLVGDIDNPTSTINAVLVTEPDVDVVIPTYVFYVKADWLGIYQPVGEPKITDVESRCFKSGENGKVDIYVKNVGDERDGFAVSVDCPSPFREDPTVEKVVQPGVTERFTLGLYADVSRKTEKTCTVKAVGLDKTDEKTFTACADPQVVCQANRWECDDNKVMRCNEFGSAMDLIEICGNGEECVYAPDGRTYCERITDKEKVCDDSVDNDDDGRTDCEDSDCDGKKCKLTDSKYGVCEDGGCVEGGECNWLNPLTWPTCIKEYVIDKIMELLGKFFLPLKIVGGLIVGLIGFTSTFDWTSKSFNKKKQKLIPFIISGLIGLSLSILFFFYLIPALIIFILYLIVKSLLVKFIPFLKG